MENKTEDEEPQLIRQTSSGSIRDRKWIRGGVILGGGGTLELVPHLSTSEEPLATLTVEDLSVQQTGAWSLLLRSTYRDKEEDCQIGFWLKFPFGALTDHWASLLQEVPRTQSVMEVSPCPQFESACRC